METNIEQNNNDEKSGGFLYGSWVYFIFLIGFIGLMIGISYAVKWLI
jgi:hypothetical protein